VKPPPFRYHAPDTLEAALVLLAEHGDDAKVMSGGQSLGPLLALRLARPGVIVDIGRVPGLAGLTTDDKHTVIGATTR
jgi:aerobic carbon-monoxide dehydrogenase medium subunit